MGFDIFRKEEAHPAAEVNAIRKELPPLPDSHIGSMGAVYTMGYGLRLALPLLGRTPATDLETSEYEEFCRYVQDEREIGEKHVASYERFVGDMTTAMPGAQVLTGINAEIGELNGDTPEDDIRVFLGKLMLSCREVNRTNVHNTARAVTWAVNATIMTRNKILDDAPKDAEALDYTIYVLKTVILHCIYVSRIGGSFAICG